MDGVSHMTYVPCEGTALDALKHPGLKRALVAAHNRWSFAKDLPFQNERDILDIAVEGENHIRVKWSDPFPQTGERLRMKKMKDLLSIDEAATGEGEPADVWINGVFVTTLTPETLEPLLKALSKTTSPKLCLRRSDGLIRIERYFVRVIRSQQIFEHIVDNLYAMEDPEIIDKHTLIGTATLPDWIMGGELTSRLWVKELVNGNIKFLRPLRNDDIKTSDRKLDLQKGKDDGKIGLVRHELKRLRWLASMNFPTRVIQCDKLQWGRTN
jgi:hypothetical protein